MPVCQQWKAKTIIAVQAERVENGKGYSKGGPGRSPYPLEIMLRIHIMQLVYNLSDGRLSL